MPDEYRGLQLTKHLKVRWPFEVRRLMWTSQPMMGREVGTVWEGMIDPEPDDGGVGYRLMSSCLSKAAAAAGAGRRMGCVDHLSFLDHLLLRATGGLIDACGGSGGGEARPSILFALSKGAGLRIVAEDEEARGMGYDMCKAVIGPDVPIGIAPFAGEGEENDVLPMTGGLFIPGPEKCGDGGIDERDECDADSAGALEWLLADEEGP
ncbi:hypothetical protein EV361DRAFT_874856 [Lentinula raphanica]|nr:hypothetical protein EV361DRAFT_874856 [Lentinula raphanica]